MSKTDIEKKERGLKLIECIEKGDKEQATKLLEAGADLGVVKMGDCPIHYATRKGRVDMLELLLSFKDNVNRPNQEKQKWPFRSSFQSILRRFDLSYMTDRSSKYCWDYSNTTYEVAMEKMALWEKKKMLSKNTPIHLAARDGHMATIQLLKERNANFNAKNEDGDTPLHGAVVIQSMDVVEKLVVLGMKVNETNKKGETALHTAALHSRQEAMEALLIKKANPTLKDKQGRTAADVAKTGNFQTLLRTYTSLIAAKDSGYITAQGMSVNPKKTKELKLDRLDVYITSIDTKNLLPFQIYCRKEKAENSAVKFESEVEGEEAISDIFHIRMTDSIETVSIQLQIPLFAIVKPREQPILKMAEKESLDFDDLILKGERMYCNLRLDLKPGTDKIFVVYTKPKIEELFASDGACVVKSKIEESFQLEVQKDTFAKDTKLNLKVYENTNVSLPARKKPKLESRVDTGRKTSLQKIPGRPKKPGAKPVAKANAKLEDKPAAQKPEITKAPEVKPLLLSDLYEINVEGNQPTKEITVQCPAIKEFKVVPESEVIIVTTDENNMKDETSLQVVQSAPKVVKGKFIFNVSHFSTYVPVLREAFDENRQDVFRQIISAKKRQQPAAFFVMVLEKVDGDPRSNIVLIEAIESRKTDSRLEFWQKKGYKRQVDGESDNILTGPNQQFVIELTGNVVVDGMESKRRLAFMPRRASSQPFRVTLKNEEEEPNGTIKLVPEINWDSDQPEGDILPKDVTLQFTLPIPPKPIDVTQSATKFDPGKTELKGPILTFLKTQFYKYPYIDQKHEDEIKKHTEALLKEYGVEKPPPVMIKNSISFCKRTYDEWKERVFYALIHNDGEVNTAAMTPEELCYYVLSDYLPPAIEDAHVDFMLMLRCHAHEQDAFIKSTHGIKRASEKTLPVTNTTFWREFEVFLERMNGKNARAMEQLRANERERIEACRKS